MESQGWRLEGRDAAARLTREARFAAQEIRPLHRIARPQSQLWTWPTIFIQTYAPKLVEEGKLTEKEHEALVNDWTARTNDPGAFFCSPPMIEIIAVKQ